jgi:hypothetical protein
VPQPKLHWSAYLWPGLPQVWLRGSWVGLALAIGFTAIANVLLAATLVWDEWLPAQARGIGLAGLGVIWVVALVEGRSEWRRLLAEWSTDAPAELIPDPRSDQMFRDAQVAYLAGDWVSAEQTLVELLRLDARDAEARLMLATLWRHEGRFDAASAELDRLERLETAAPWQDEITRERERIAANRVKTELLKVQGEGDNLAAEVAPTARDAAVRPDLSGSGNSVPATLAAIPPGTEIAPDAATNRRMAA